VNARPVAARHNKEFFMKNAYKLLGITALALAIVFSFAACDNSTSSGGNNNNGPSVVGGGSGEFNFINFQLSSTDIFKFSSQFPDYKIQVN
jgi:hypothetical protein